MSEILIGLNCLTSLLFFVVLIIVVIWLRSRVQALQKQIDQLQAQEVLPRPQAAPPPVISRPPAPVVVPRPTPAPEQSGVGKATPPLEEAQPVAASAAVNVVPQPPRPPLWQRLAQANPLVGWFVRSNPLVQIGVLVLFFGVGFLVRYAADQGWFPLELRLISAALLGGVLAGVGWLLRRRARTYGLALQGGGIGIVYLTTYGAYQFYNLIPSALAFVVFVVLGVTFALLALLNDALILALLATIGAFLAPVLAAGDGGSHVILFSYYALINAVLFAIAWFKSWRVLNVVSFFFTVGIGLAWGVQNYQPADFASTEFFVILFFGFFLVISLLLTRRHADELPGRLDTLLIFANPLATLLIQAQLLAGRDDRTFLQWTLVQSLIYAGLALWGTRGLRIQPLVVEFFLFLATFFLAISIPQGVEPGVTAAIWAVQGVGVLWLSVRRGRMWGVLWGTLIELGAALAFLAQLDEGVVTAARPYLNQIYISTVVISLSGLLAGWLLRRTATDETVKTLRWLGWGHLVWGVLWWFGGGLNEATQHIADDYQISSAVAFVALSGLAYAWVGRWLGWPGLRRVSEGMLPLALWLAVIQAFLDPQPFVGGGWYAWPLLLIAHLTLLWQWPADNPRTPWRTLHHAGGVWLLAWLVTSYTAWLAWERTESLTLWGVALLAAPTLILLAVGPLQRRMPWPVGAESWGYALVAAAPLALYLSVAALLLSIRIPGDSPWFSYLPVLNLLDLTLLALVIVLFGWLRTLRRDELLTATFTTVPLFLLWGVLAFLLANGGVARAVHQLTGVPFTAVDLYRSATLQSTYAIFWGALSVVLMFGANRLWRQGGRVLWFSGAAILGLTVLKLFIVDLANTGTVARIVSFMGVGLLIIVIAYFAPAPHRQESGGQ
jgi:uncharacterized membrane protein